MTDAAVIQRLVLVAVLAGLIGIERERHGRAAGFRTHILVGVGSCLVMLTGLYLANGMAADPTRMGSQVISGIGFLGAGTILRFRASVRGLTTAASLWAVAGIGLAVGAGFWLGGTVATAIVMVTLFGFGRLERSLRRELYRTLVVETSDPGGGLASIRRVLGEHDVEVRDFEISASGESGVSKVQLELKLIGDRSQREIAEQLSRLPHVKRAQWEE